MTTHKTDQARDTEILEQMVDTHSLQTVLTLLELICADKADHLSVNWQDAASAKLWTRAAKACADAARKPAVVNVSL